MAIALFFSNRLEILVEKLSQKIHDEMRGTDPLQPSLVIVPNMNLAKWLQLCLARLNGICMHLRFDYLEGGLYRLLGDLDSEPHQARLLDQEAMAYFLLATLYQLPGDDTDFDPLRGYLPTVGSHSPVDAAQVKKSWQLARQLAHLFQEYELNRGDMIRAWLRQPSPSRGGEDALEHCQRKLYRRLMALIEEVNGTARNADRGPLVTLGGYFHRWLAARQQAAPRPQSQRGIHLFGLSHISHLHLEIIAALKSIYPVSIYALNPCQEFWEDIQSPPEKRWFKRRMTKLTISPAEEGQGELFTTPDHPLLSAWGKPGRENVRLLCALFDYEFETRFQEAQRGEGESVLARIQNGILTLEGQRQRRPPIFQDTSLQIIACPGIRREVETAYHTILANLAADESLKLTDIALLVPEMSAYQPVFEAVFNRQPTPLKYNLVDASARTQSHYAAGVISLLDLAMERFSRGRIIALALNPCFMAKWGITGEDVTVWAGWMETLNIYHGFAGGEDPGQDQGFTFQQGLRRLRLGRIMTPADAPPASQAPGQSLEIGRHFQGILPHSDIHCDPRLIEQLALVITSLHTIGQRLRGLQTTAEKWQAVLPRCLDEVLAIPDEMPGEAMVRQKLMDGLERLTLLDGLVCSPSEKEKGTKTGASAAQAAFPLDLAHMAEFVETQLGGLAGGKGEYLTGGVTIAALVPMRPIPFRIIHILGMQEGNFPGREEHSALDLRRIKRRIGDISGPERNRYLFLEMLLSVREKLYISYLSRDLQKDVTLQPCQVVNQLRRHIAEACLGSVPFEICHIPLAASDPRYLADSHAQSAPWSDVMVNYSLADHVSLYRSMGAWERFIQGARADEKRRVASLKPDLRLASAASERHGHGMERVERVSIGELKGFILDPVKQRLRRHLGIYDEKEALEDIAAREDEPFYSEFPVDYLLRTEPVNQLLGQLFRDPAGGQVSVAAAAQDHFEALYHDYQRRGHTPPKGYGAADRTVLQEQVLLLAEQVAHVIPLLKGAQERLVTVRMGAYADAVGPLDAAVKNLDPLRLSLPAAEAESTLAVALSGQLPFLWQGPRGGWHALVITGAANPARRVYRYCLEPLLFYLASLAREGQGTWMRAGALTVHVIGREGHTERTYHEDPGTARHYLKTLAAHYLVPGESIWLPFETVTDLASAPHRATPEDLADEKRAADLARNFRVDLQEALEEGREPLMAMARPTLPQDVFWVARERFSIIYNILDGAEGE